MTEPLNTDFGAAMARQIGMCEATLSAADTYLKTLMTIDDPLIRALSGQLQIVRDEIAMRQREIAALFED